MGRKKLIKAEIKAETEVETESGPKKKKYKYEQKKWGYKTLSKESMLQRSKEVSVASNKLVCRKALKRPKCKHRNRMPNPAQNNLKGDYYEWQCNDCGYKKLEGRTFAHKELCEYATHLKTFVLLGNKRDSEQCLQIMQEMIIDALRRMRNKETGKRYFLEIF
jgi:hypothetical protein